MSDREALYAAILAHPDEDTPRLVFADWLQENGNERYATFIRKQIELARVPEWDPVWLRAWHNERDTITGRGFEEFRPALGVGLDWEPLVSFRRGFAWHVKTANPGPFLEHAQRLFAEAPLGAVRFGHHGETWREPYQVAAFVASPWLARLSEITFNVARFTEDNARAFAACPHLERLKRLSFTLCTHDRGALGEFLVPALLDKLEVFELGSSQSNWAELVRRLTEYRGPGRLRRFAASPFNLAHFTHNQVFGAPVLSELRELQIDGYATGPAHIRAMCEAPFASRLESLSLNKTKPGVPGVTALAECASLRGLQCLELANNALGPVAMKRLAASHLTGLSVLDLANNPLGDKGALELAKAPWLKNLISLKLMHCAIGTNGALALGEALDPNRLVHLELYSDLLRGQPREKVITALAPRFGRAVSV